MARNELGGASRFQGNFRTSTSYSVQERLPRLPKRDAVLKKHLPERKAGESSAQWKC